MATELKALLLAAGLGTRLRPLTDVLPKCLMPINGTPLLGLWLARLCGAGITDVVVNLHHHAALVRAYVERSPFAAFVTLAEEPQLLGTAGTLTRHREHFAGAPVLFAHADNLSLFEPQQFAAAHRARAVTAAMTMMTFRTDTPRDCGIVRLDPHGTVIEFHEKTFDPPGDLANAAVYIVEPEVIEYARSRGASDFSTQVLPHFVGRIHTFHNSAYHRDIGTLAGLIRAQFEYPVACAASDRSDQWHGLLARHGGGLAHSFTRALAAALDTRTEARLSTPGRDRIEAG
jgi:mannose-1-phosphate guanylyltransferase